MTEIQILAITALRFFFAKQSAWMIEGISLVASCCPRQTSWPGVEN
jgi:hypothetical protein